MQALYGMLLKSTCVFVRFFHLFGGRNFQKLLFFDRNVFFPLLLNLLFFLGNHHYSEIADTRSEISFEVCHSVVTSWKKIWPHFTQHTLACTTVHIRLWICTQKILN